MAKYKISVTEGCIGCEACTNVCDNFKMINGKSKPIKEIVEELGCNEEARDICPVSAIEVEEIK